MSKGFEFRGFISYSHKDEAFASWLHNALETYSIPRRLRGTMGLDGRVPSNLFRIYRDRAENPAAADLGAVITEALRKSTYLIVLCSPDAARSQWVNQEILDFKKFRRENRILPVIVSGEPNAADKAGADPATECFPHALRHKIGPNGRLTDERTEPIAADARPQGDGRRNSKLKVVAGLLGVTYDAIKRREDGRRLRRSLAAVTLGAAILGAGALRLWDIYNRGSLSAESDPLNSTISVDGVELGSRIVGLPLPAGKATLKAWAPDHFESNRTIDVIRGEENRTRFWLEYGWESQPYLSQGLQESAIAVQAEDDTVIASNELAEITYWSARSGAVVSALPIPEGERRTFAQVDLGGDVGRVIVSGLEPKSGPPEAVAITAEYPPKFLWRARAPAGGFAQTSSVAAIAIPSATDGPARLGLAGRNGRIYLFDGASGELVADFGVSDGSLLKPPTLRMGVVRDSPAMLVIIQPGDPDGPVQDRPPQILKAIDPTSGTLLGSVNIEAGWQAGFADGNRAVIAWSASGWRLIDLQTLADRSRGKLEGALAGAPAVQTLAQHGLGLIIPYVAPLNRIDAVRAADGAALWTSIAKPDPTRHMRGPSDDAMLTTARGDIVVAVDGALAAIDPATGALRWTSTGKVRGALAGDCDGSGQVRIIAALSGSLVCVNDDGSEHWRLKLDDENLSPRMLAPSPNGGRMPGVVVSSRSGKLGMVHGPRRQWKVQAIGPLQATPVVAATQAGRDVVVEVGAWSDGAGLRAFDADTGTTVWSAHEAFAPNRGVRLADLDGYGAPMIVGLGRQPPRENVVLLAYRPTDGALLRAVATEVKGWMSSEPVAADYRGIGKSDVAFSTWDEQSIVMVDGRSGETLWRSATDAQNMGGVSAGDVDGDGLADVVAASFDGNVYALRGKDGQLLWKAPIEEGGWAPPTITPNGADGTLVSVVSQSGRLYVLDGKTGTLAWVSSEAGGHKPAGSPLILEEGGRRLILAPQGFLGAVAYDLASGAEIWRSPEGLPVVSSPLLADLDTKGSRAVVVATASGDVLSLDPGTGRLLRREHVSDKLIEGDLALARSTSGLPLVVAPSHDYGLYAIRGPALSGSP